MELHENLNMARENVQREMLRIGELMPDYMDTAAAISHVRHVLHMLSIINDAERLASSGFTEYANRCAEKVASIPEFKPNLA